MNRLWNRLSVKFAIYLLISILIPVGIIFFTIAAIYSNLVKEEVRLSTEKTLAYCQREIDDVFSGMVTVSGIINNDSIFMGALKSQELDYYEKCVMFNRLIQTIYLQNFGLSDDTKIFLTDWQNNSYCNLSAKNSVLYTEEQRLSAEGDGSLRWSFNGTDSSGSRVFSMSRKLYNNNVLSDPIGNLVISIGENQLATLLEEYVDLSQDCVLLYLDDGQFVTGFTPHDIPPETLFVHATAALRTESANNSIHKIEQQKYLMNCYTIDSLLDFEGRKLNVLVLSDYERIFGAADATMSGILLLLCAAYCVVLGIGLYLPQKITTPIRKLDVAVRNFKVGDSPINDSNVSNDEVGSLYSGFRSLSQSINTLFENLKKESAIKENYRYETLRAQLNPHFLFNTLNSIKLSAKLIHAEHIVENIEALANMLRYSMSKEENLVAFSRELQNIENYLQIQNNRFGNNILLDLDDTVQPYLDCKVLKFVLQPIVENSVLHGFQNYTENGIITISCKEKDGCLMICVQDNGKGFASQEVESYQQVSTNPNRRFNGLGLAAVQKIIQVIHGNAYGLEICSTPYEGTRVIYHLPMITSEENMVYAGSDSSCR